MESGPFEDTRPLACADAGDDAGHLHPGEVVAGAYRIVDRLGAGSMGVVYRARDVHLDRQVAVKLMRPDLADDPGLTRQFLAEARTLAEIRHPNVVGVHAYGTTARTPYFVMEYVDGSDLQAWLGRCPQPPSLSVVVDVIEQIARGLGALHAARIVHRDLKPANVLITSEGRAVVADLGLSHRSNRMPPANANSVNGTPAFVAPELVQGLVIPPSQATRIDIYALGVVAYELLTGHLPFVAGDAAQALAAQVAVQAAPVSSVRGDVGPAVDRTIAKALEKDPRERWPDVHSFAQALRAAAERGAPAPRVLLVDDDAGYRTLLRAWLMACLPEATVQEAEHGRAALEMIEAGFIPELLVTDLHMPIMGGQELIARLAQDKRLRQLSVIAVTGEGGARDWQTLRSLGVEALHLKPVDPRRFAADVRALVQRSGA
jgi:serine/threonine-protein kinase